LEFVGSENSVEEQALLAGKLIFVVILLHFCFGVLSQYELKTKLSKMATRLKTSWKRKLLEKTKTKTFPLRN